MDQLNQQLASEAVFRVDKFVVPAAAREEILRKVRATHELLRVQPGLTRRSYLAGAGADERNRSRFADALGRAGLPG